MIILDQDFLAMIHYNNYYVLLYKSLSIIGIENNKFNYVYLNFSNTAKKYIVKLKIC